jgi:hypothetical protein
MSAYNENQGDNESYLQQFINISTEFVDTVARLKNNFTVLGSRYGDARSVVEKPDADKDRPRISNFDMFVSEHTENSAKAQLRDTCEPSIEESEFDGFEAEEPI